MNGQAAKRLRLAAVRHYIANNQRSTVNPAIILKRTYRVMKKRYKSMPYHQIQQEFPFESHGVVLAKIHNMRTRSKVEKFLDPKATNKINAQNVNELAGDL